MLARHISALNKYKVSSKVLVQKLSRLSSTAARVPRAFPNSGPAPVRAETLLEGLLADTRTAPSLPLQWGRHRTRHGTVHKFPFISRRSSSPLSSWTRELHVFPETYSQTPPPSVRTLRHEVGQCVKFFPLPSSCHSHVICGQYMFPLLIRDSVRRSGILHNNMTRVCEDAYSFARVTFGTGVFDAFSLVNCAKRTQDLIDRFISVF